MANSARNDAKAAVWAIRLDRGSLTEAEALDLGHWLEGDERRRGALLRAEATLAYLDRGRALANARPNDLVSETAWSPRTRRSFLIRSGAVAGFAAAGMATFFAVRDIPTELRTGRGEIRRVPLADGSVASINTASALVVKMAEKRRDVTLEVGEAWFQVAKDRRRPFLVRAGRVRVEAVGTAFSVRLRDEGADVLVTEGTVRVWIKGRESEAVLMSANLRAFAAASGGVIEARPADGSTARSLAWRTGEIALDGESLDHTVAELNRYNARQLVVDTPDLGREPLVGFFRLDQPDDFSRAIAATLGARVTVERDTIHLSR